MEKLPKTQQINPGTNADKTKIKVKKEVSKPARLVENEEKISEKLQELQVSANDPTIELSKKLKRIRRKLREVEILDEKIKANEIAPEKDQLEKISRRKKFEEVKIKILNTFDSN